MPLLDIAACVMAELPSAHRETMLTIARASLYSCEAALKPRSFGDEDTRLKDTVNTCEQLASDLERAADNLRAIAASCSRMRSAFIALDPPKEEPWLEAEGEAQ